MQEGLAMVLCLPSPALKDRVGDEEGEAGPAPGPSAWVPYLAERAYYDVNSPGKLKNDITSQCLVKIY